MNIFSKINLNDNLQKMRHANYRATEATMMSKQRILYARVIPSSERMSFSVLFMISGCDQQAENDTNRNMS